MAYQGGSFFERRRLQRAVRRASALAENAAGLSAADLASADGDIERLRQRIDAADRAVEAARATRAASRPIDGPEQCDWALRPDIWQSPVRPRGAVALSSPTSLSPGITLYHDCPAPELSFHQSRRTGPGAARYALVLEVYRFGGSFISLVQDLPDGAITGLTLQHFFAVSLDITLEQPLEIYARLNLQHGPNTEQMVRELPVADGRALAEFDLAYAKINERRMEKAWLDLIFEGPSMNRIRIDDLTVTRAPRADV